MEGPNLAIRHLGFCHVRFDGSLWLRCKIGKLKIDLCVFVLKSMFSEGSNRFALPASWLEQEMSEHS